MRSRVPEHDQVWKRRLRNAPSAKSDGREIILSIHWVTNETDPALPTTATRKDPLLWSIWLMKTGWVYLVYEMHGGIGGAIDPKEFRSEREALTEYKRRVKTFPRSKEVDYGFPLDDSEAG
jgi:hypothetical protein